MSLSQIHVSRPVSIPICQFPECHYPDGFPLPKGVSWGPDRGDLVKIHTAGGKTFGKIEFGRTTWSGLVHSGKRLSVLIGQYNSENEKPQLGIQNWLAINQKNFRFCPRFFWAQKLKQKNCKIKVNL